MLPMATMPVPTTIPTRHTSKGKSNRAKRQRYQNDYRILIHDLKF